MRAPGRCGAGGATGGRSRRRPAQTWRASAWCGRRPRQPGAATRRTSTRRRGRRQTGWWKSGRRPPRSWQRAPDARRRLSPNAVGGVALLAGAARGRLRRAHRHVRGGGRLGSLARFGDRASGRAGAARHLRPGGMGVVALGRARRCPAAARAPWPVCAGCAGADGGGRGSRLDSVRSMTRRQRATAAPGSVPVLRLVAPGQPVSATELHAVLADSALSFAAKGVLALVLARSPSAVIDMGDLFAASADPMPLVERAVDELVPVALLAMTPPGRAASSTAGGVVIGRGRPCPPQGGWLTATFTGQLVAGSSRQCAQAPKRRSAWGQRTPLTTTPRVWSVPAGRESDRTRRAHNATRRTHTTTLAPTTAHTDSVPCEVPGSCHWPGGEGEAQGPHRWPKGSNPPDSPPAPPAPPARRTDAHAAARVRPQNTEPGRHRRIARADQAGAGAGPRGHAADPPDQRPHRPDRRAVGVRRLRPVTGMAAAASAPQRRAGAVAAVTTPASSRAGAGGPSVGLTVWGARS